MEMEESFVNLLVKNLQMLCHDHLPFQQSLDITGHVCIHVDDGANLIFFLNEKCKKVDMSSVFTSLSFQSPAAFESITISTAEADKTNVNKAETAVKKPQKKRSINDENIDASSPCKAMKQSLSDIQNIEKITPKVMIKPSNSKSEKIGSMNPQQASSSEKSITVPVAEQNLHSSNLNDSITPTPELQSMSPRTTRTQTRSQKKLTSSIESSGISKSASDSKATEKEVSEKETESISNDKKIIHEVQNEVTNNTDMGAGNLSDGDNDNDNTIDDNDNNGDDGQCEDDIEIHNENDAGKNDHDYGDTSIKNEDIPEMDFGSFTQLEGEEYTIVDMATKKGRPMLVDNIGFSYNIRRNTDRSVIWACSVRNKKTNCSAGVTQLGDHYQRNKHGHIHPPIPGLLTSTLIRAEARAQATNDSVTPTSQVVQRAMTVKGKSEDETFLPRSNNLKRMINRCRQYKRDGRPKSRKSAVVKQPVQQIFMVTRVSESE